MNTYLIRASVETVAMRTLSDGTWNGSVQLPPFRVAAASRREAEALAREIIDPLDMAPPAEITVTEEAAAQQEKATAQLGPALDRAVKTLNSSSNTPEYSLYSLAAAVAGVLGLDLDALLHGEAG